VSRYALAHGGKDIRTRSGALIDNVLKIDFGPDTFAQCATLKLHPQEWKWIVFTHTHYDHFTPQMLQYAFPPFVEEGSPAPEVFGNKAILDGFRGAFDQEQQLKRRLIKSFETIEIGDYEVTPIRAYHKLDEDSLNLIIRKNGSTLLYALDTGVYQQETWDFLKGWKLDCAIIECTDGFNPADYWGHLSCAELLEVVNRLRDMGCLNNGSPICTSHHSHTGLATHAELEDFLVPNGIQVGYDGKALNF
jgi:phosphoribosyl 1,2-cyclic phosphate phosphodiesterase